MRVVSTFVILLSISLLDASAAAAQEQVIGQEEVKAGLRGCAQVEPDSLRLKCFDLLAQTLEESGSDVETAEGDGAVSAGWVVNEEKDPLTDRTKWTVAIRANPETSTLTRGGFLAITCVDREFRIVASWGEYLGDNTREIRVWV